jgi:hypothetical protein
MIGRHPFKASAERAILCAICGMTRGSIYHSKLGSNKHLLAQHHIGDGSVRAQPTLPRRVKLADGSWGVE